MDMSGLILQLEIRQTQLHEARPSRGRTWRMKVYQQRSLPKKDPVAWGAMSGSFPSEVLRRLD